MTLFNCTRSGCKDVFKSYLVRTAEYETELEIPVIEAEEKLPERLISFSSSISSKDYGAWIHFYEDDANFERLWNNPQKYLPILKKFAGVILPDFSLYRDMPLVMQYWNIYRSRAIGHWLQENGIHVIPNIRFGDERTYKVCCAGIPKKSVISIGSHGCIKLRNERHYFEKGLDFVINNLEPKVIIIYGALPDTISEKCKKHGICIIKFESEFATAHKKKRS